MSTTHTILSSLQKHLTSNKARLKTLSGLITGVIREKTTNLRDLSRHQESEATDHSDYRKLQRFFKEWKFSWEETAKLTLDKVPKPPEGYVLSIDRTNWKFGRTHINILTIGIVVGKVSIPLVWMTLPQETKRGNSNTEQRIDLMERLLKVLPAKDIHSINMDREFCGYEWLYWLNNRKITFVLRLRKNTKVAGKDAKLYSSTKKAKTYQKKEVFGMNLYFACKYITKGRADYLYVVSNNLDPIEALETYKKRWSIEVLFGHLKKKGFNLESTHMKAAEKIDKLIAVLALAFLFTVGWGILMKENSTLNAHDKRKSTFRLALDMLQSTLNEPSKHKGRLEEFGKWISSDLKPQFFVV